MNADDLKPGDVVLTKVVVEVINSNVMRVHTTRISGDPGVSFWLHVDEVELVQPPHPAGRVLKYAVGDEVIHRDCPRLGIGKITQINPIGANYLSEIDAKGNWYQLGVELHTDYLIDWEFHPLYDGFLPRGWPHAEEFLLPARRKGGEE